MSFTPDERARIFAASDQNLAALTQADMVDALHAYTEAVLTYVRKLREAGIADELMFFQVTGAPAVIVHAVITGKL
jgi:hypothetical protein